MHFLEWLDRHFVSNCHYYYADDLGCPLEFLLYPTSQSTQDPQGEGRAVVPQASAIEQPTNASAWQ